MAAVEEAVGVYRELAQERPDAFLPSLAMSLHNQSYRLGDLGQGEEALAALEEAIGLILPLLERNPYALPDSGLRLLEDYAAVCGNLDREPDEQLMERMGEVLVAVEYP